MVKQSESAKYGYTYIPPSVQKSIASHMDRTMPANLKKYQNSRYVPQHAEKAMSQHLQKSLPSHLKKYADSYVYQNVTYPSAGGGAGRSFTPPAGGGVNVKPLPRTLSPRQKFSSDETVQAQPQPETAPNEDSNQDPYDFIMNPQKPPRPAFTLPGDSMVQRIVMAVAGLIVFIVLAGMASSFLNKANNTQRQKLISLAQTQSEIARVADEASEKISDKNLLYKASTVRVTMQSSQQEVVSALAKRGKKIKDKVLNVQNPANDAVLSEGEQNGRYDEAYTQLLTKQLNSYQAQLQGVYDTGSPSEKNIVLSANNQIKLLLASLSQQ